MKSVTDLLQRTPWWALLFAGLATFAALAVFVTPYHILQYRDDGKSAEESRAIKREIDNAFAENAINVGRGVVRGMLARTTDPERRAELEDALRGIEEAREELKNAGTEALRAKREALASVREATRHTLEAIRTAKRETQEALRQVDPADAAMKKQLEESLKAAEAAEKEAAEAMAEGKVKDKKRIVIGKGKPILDIEIDPQVAPPAPPAIPAPPALEGVPAPPAAEAPPALAPEVATKIRRDVTGDMYRIGIGAALILILLPIFILAVITKFFADRSRASQRVAEAKRKEADYHRMGQQVTEAKLAALQAQVEPHFLYNTLASVQALTEVDPAKANLMTGHLIQYLRNALPKMRESVSTVGQEVELVRAYLSILQMRMGSRLAFEIDVPEGLMALPFPPLMLPSLVENAIKHGLEPQREGGVVRIGASLEGGRLRVVAADTGRGFGDTVGAGVGLANIRERLAALYGSNASLKLEGNEPHGVVATIEVPADGTRSGAGADAPGTPAFAAWAPSASSTEVPPPIPQSGASPPPQPAMAREGFWPRVWNGVIVFERIWRKVLYYLFLGLLVVAGVAAVGAVVGIAIGAIPVTVDDNYFTGPVGLLIGLAGAVIAFVAVAAALAVVILIIYCLGFFLAAVALFVIVVFLISLSPVLAPFILLGLGIWWLARRSKRQVEAAPAPVPGPTPAPDPSPEAGR